MDTGATRHSQTGGPLTLQVCVVPALQGTCINSIMSTSDGRPKPFVPTVLDDESLFRFQVVSSVRALELRGTPRRKAVAQVADQLHPTLDGSLRRISKRSVYRWLAAYERSDIDGLRTQQRPKVPTSKILPADFVEFLQSEKQFDSVASVPEIIRRARLRGILGPKQAVDRTTVWRACQRMKLPTRDRPHKRDADTRRFAHPHRMSVVLCDGKHFRAGPTRQRRVALFFLDDASRYGIHVVVGTSENTVIFLRGLYETIRRCGFADVYFLDGGPGFISSDTISVIAALPFAHLVHGTANYPEGHGKIEKFNQTALHDVLRSFDGALDVDPDCGALALRLQHYLSRVYNHRPHESLDGETPAQRFERDERPLRFPEDDDKLRQHFLVTEDRKVSPDHVISLDGTDYEAPRGTARRWSTVYRHVFTGDLWVLHEGKLVGLAPVDLAQNARDRRAKPRLTPETSHNPPPKTAATLAFEQDFAPVVGPDGGFSDP